MKTLFFSVLTCLALIDAQAQPFNPKKESSLTEKIAAHSIQTEEERGSGIKLAPNSLWNCKNESLSVNVWLISHHTGNSHRKGLNENNYGAGLVYTCDRWSLAVDRMINSNKGKADVLSAVWNTGNLELGPMFVNGNIGYARVSYGVPRYNATLHENTPVVFLGTGLNAFPRLTINVAPVPKVAGEAYILWVKYTVVEFK